MPVEQGADFRQPPVEPEPAPARRPLAPGETRTAISERYHHGLRHVQDQLTN